MSSMLFKRDSMKSVEFDLASSGPSSHQMFDKLENYIPRQLVSAYEPITEVTPLGFGSQVKRFLNKGTHPKLETEGSLKNNPKVSPATYFPENFKRKNVPCINWRNANRTNMFSKTLGGKVPHVLEARKFMRETLGPAHYELPETSIANINRSGNVRENTGFSVAKRFARDLHSNTPGPGTYGKNHIPDQLREENRVGRRTWTHVPPFEWDGFAERSLYPIRSFHLAANRYHPKDPNTIDELLKKRVSKRGPYDLFTGPRDETTLTGYWGPPTFKGPLNYFRALPNEMDKLKKRQIGKWMPGSRFLSVPTSRNMISSITLCRKDPNSPGPAAYFPTRADQKPIPAVTFPFDSSIVEVRPQIGFKIRPGVGRYSVGYNKYVNGHTNLFKGKIGQRSKWMVPEQMNSF